MCTFKQRNQDFYCFFKSIKMNCDINGMKNENNGS